MHSIDKHCIKVHRLAQLPNLRIIGIIFSDQAIRITRNTRSMGTVPTHPLGNLPTCKLANLPTALYGRAARQLGSYQVGKFVGLQVLGQKKNAPGEVPGAVMGQHIGFAPQKQMENHGPRRTNRSFWYLHLGHAKRMPRGPSARKGVEKYSRFISVPQYGQASPESVLLVTSPPLDNLDNIHPTMDPPKICPFIFL